MTPRLSSDMLVTALIRRVESEGGHAMILARGDRGGGAVLILCAERGQAEKLLERTLDINGSYVWTRCGPEDPQQFQDYLDRRRARDPDLWIVELDIAQAERFAAETIC